MLDFTVHMRFVLRDLNKYCFYATSKVQNVFPLYELDNKVTESIKLLLLLVHSLPRYGTKYVKISLNLGRLVV